jgi:MFS family permease
VQALICSALLWSVGFLLIWITGIAPASHLLWAILGLSVMAIATAAYNPSASALVVDLAPESLRGVYLSINSLCWAVGYFIGPTVGGWAMDHTRWIAQTFWVSSALSVLLGIAILLYLGKVIRHLHDG